MEDIPKKEQIRSLSWALNEEIGELSKKLEALTFNLKVLSRELNRLIFDEKIV